MIEKVKGEMKGRKKDQIADDVKEWEMRNGSVGTSKGYYKGRWMGKRKGKKKVSSWLIRLKERTEYQELGLANPQCETELVESRIEE